MTANVDPAIRSYAAVMLHGEVWRDTLAKIPFSLAATGLAAAGGGGLLAAQQGIADTAETASTSATLWSIAAHTSDTTHNCTSTSSYLS